MSETITVLSTEDNHRFCKTFDADGTKGRITFPIEHTATVGTASGISELSELLRLLECDHSSYIIRGTPKDLEADTCTRRKGDLFEPQAGKSWLMFDFDKLQAPTDLDVCDPAACAAHAVSQLPSEFQGVSYHYHASGSAGLKPGEVRTHIWFWLSTPAHSIDLKKAFRDSELVDTSMFTLNQVHYTANPIFEDGTANPITVPRGGLITLGADTVDLGALLGPTGAAEGIEARKKKAANFLAGQVKKIKAQAGDGKRHAVIHGAAYVIAKDFIPEYIAESEVRAALEGAEAACKDPPGR